MSLIVIGSTRSSGATTVAMALAAWLDGAVLVEADPDGGVLALRYGLSREPGLLTLAAAREVDRHSLLDHAQPLPGGLPVVVAPESPERSASLLRTAGARVASLLARLDNHTVVDAGRLATTSPAAPFAPQASALLLVTRPRADELVAAAERLAALAAVTGGVAALVLAGAGPYSADDVTTQLHCPVLGTIAEDPRAARALAQGGSAKTLARSALARSARTVAKTLLALPVVDATLSSAAADTSATNATGRAHPAEARA